MKTYEKYKDSGVEWIGDIPEHWEVRKLKRVCQVKRGASPRPIDSPKYFDDNGEFGWVRISDVTRSERYLEETQQYLSKLGTQCSVKMYPNDIFLSIAGSVGKAIITKVKCCIHDGFVWFKGLKIDTEFLYYIFQISRIYEGLGKEGTQLNLNTETIGSVTIPFISISEQQKIASYLDKKSEAIDQFIKNKESLINLLEEEKKAIITKAVTKGLDKDVKLKDSGVEWLGEIPEHWDSSRLATFGRFSKGIGLPKSELVKDGVSAILYGDIYTKYNLKAVNIINHVTEKSSLSSQEIKKGDILFTGSGETKEDIGKCIVYLGYEKAYAGSDIIIFYQKKHDSLFLSYYLNSNLAIDQKIVSSKGEIIVHIYASKLKEIYIAIPSLKEQQAIVTYLDEQTKKIDDLKYKYRQEIDLIKEYKERLIYDVVTGKINVMQE